MNAPHFRLADFDFSLPEGLIALHPASPRDAARLLVVPKLGEIQDRLVRDLPDLLRPDDVLVMNDTKVIPAQLEGRRGEARIELTLHRNLGAGRWLAFAKPARKLKTGDAIDIAEGFAARVESKTPEGDIVLDFSQSAASLDAHLERFGAMPLPPYIRKRRAVTPIDKTDYQTVYARASGAIAAPTAGLHFTPDLLARLDARGIERHCITLHVGAGTFLPVKREDIDRHRLHAERGEIAPRVATAITRAKRQGRRIIAIGTTSLRLLESAATEGGEVRPFSGETDIFIMPGYKFRIVDVLMTNFHLPKSTLFMLVAAFAGLGRMQAAYAHAIRAEYRFYSYGDASLLELAP
jgi:S-adenosylmethionine:tRNA ribosyltransferase-isomerase